MKSQQSVGVLGGGSWGTTLAHLLGSNGHRVLLWLRDQHIREQIQQQRLNEKYLPAMPLSANIEPVADLAKVAQACQFIILALPAKAFREVALRLGDFVRGDHILISATKGLDPQSRSTMSDVIREETCCRKIGALSGPNLAREIMLGQPAATIVGSRFDEVINMARALLNGPHFRIYGSHDLVGVELGGALKNIIALAAGIVNGMGWGDNTKAFLVSRGLAEMMRLGVFCGAQPATFTGLSGIGDLMVTCASPLSRNHQVGYRLGQGEKIDAIINSMVMVAEGVYTTKVVHEFACKKGLSMPITAAIYRIIYEDVPVDEAAAFLLRRETKHEFQEGLLELWSSFHQP